MKEKMENTQSPPASALVLTTKTGVITIRKDAVISVEHNGFSGRNMTCKVNGIDTTSGYDFVTRELGWDLRECA